MSVSNFSGSAQRSQSPSITSKPFMDMTELKHALPFHSGRRRNRRAPRVPPSEDNLPEATSVLKHQKDQTLHQTEDEKKELERLFPKFDELKVSTITVVVYSNIFFDFLKLFNKLPIVQNPYGANLNRNRKRKLVNKKDLDVPYGSILMVNYGNHLRGLDMRKTKKRHWCYYTCRLTQRKGDKIVKINTVVEEHVPVEGTDLKEIRYWCTNCQRYYTLKQLDKICNFLNQLTVVLSIGNGTYLSIMVFSNKIKIAGCRRKREAYEAIMILWENYVRETDCYIPLETFNALEEEKPSHESICTAIEKFNRSSPSESREETDPLSKNNFTARFLFRTVMRNVGFNLGFYINRQQFNDMMNGYSVTGNLVKASFCDATAHPNVRTKYFTFRPNGHTYRVLNIPADSSDREGASFFENATNNDFKMASNCKKEKDKRKTELLTAIVFLSSQVIFSSRYKEDSKRIYQHFIETINKHRLEISERPDTMSLLKDFDPSEFMI